MKTIIATIAAACVLSLAGQSLAEDNSGIMKPVNGFIEATGAAADIDRAASYWTANQSMVDEFAPYHWTGPNAVRTWWKGLLKDNKANGSSDVVVTSTAAARVQRSGLHAYVVQPANVSFNTKGQHVSVTGALTFALDRTKTGWKIASCAWTDLPTP